LFQQPLQDQQHQNKRNSAADAAIIEEVEDANLAQAAIAHQVTVSASGETKDESH
jgi:hypothetical protein